MFIKEDTDMQNENDKKTHLLMIFKHFDMCTIPV